MATHSSILIWEIPWIEEPGGQQSIGLQRVRQDQAHTMFIKYLGYTSVSLPRHYWHLGLDDFCLVRL